MKTNKRTLEEQRNDCIEQMQNIVDSVKAECRALTDDEAQQLENLRAETGRIDRTLGEIDNMRNFDVSHETPEGTALTNDEKAFVRFMRGEKRALSASENGGIVPTTIADRIIVKVKELSRIYAMATIYNVGGDLKFPVFDDTSLAASYVDELTEPPKTSGSFTTISLENYIIGLTTIVSKSLITRTDIDVLNFVVNAVAQKIAEFLEKELISGTTKLNGIITAEPALVTASETAITAEELIDLEMSIPQTYSQNACFIMNKDTFKKLRKLKDGDGNFLLARDFANTMDWNLLGHAVYITESMPKATAGEKPIVYGDMSGLYVKLSHDVEIMTLTEKYAEMHAIGITAHVECDSKIVEKQKIVTLQMKGTKPTEPTGGEG